MKTLIIAEKPDMGRNIASVLEPKASNKRSYIEGEQYIITWAIGHLIGLAEPDDYDDRYKKWNFADLPIIPNTFKLVPQARTKDQLKVIAELAKRSQLIVNACDAGREGQLIFSYIQQHLRLRHPVKRLWISDLTKETISKGFQQLKDASEYENLTKAARARSEADWLIGMNGSRAFTTKHRTLLTVGRVQTPVLALIYDRQVEIDAFTSTTSYDVEAIFKQEETIYKGIWQGEQIIDPTKAEQLAKKVANKRGNIAEYEVKETKEYPYRLYDLTLLQREANAKYSFSAKKTLEIAQSLYEKHKVISYPRTNSNYVNEQNIPEMHKSLEALRGTGYEKLVAGANKGLVHKNNRQVCNPAKVEDHHAILPTMRKAGALTEDERKIYDLVVRRFLSHFYPPAEYKVHTVMTEVEQELFKTTIKEQLKAGWKEIYADMKDRQSGAGKKKGETSDEDTTEDEWIEQAFVLDALKAVECTETSVKEKKSQPPKYYTEGTLLRAMESAGRKIEDDQLREAMKEAGLGTPATRAAMIERLKQVGYIEMRGKQIRITVKGKTAIELIRGAGVELLASPEMTGQWEKRLHEIARGQASDEQFLDRVRVFTRMIVDKVRLQQQVKASLWEENEGTAQTARSRTKSKASKARIPSKSNGTEQAVKQRNKLSTQQSINQSTKLPTKAVQSSTPPLSREAITDCPREGCGGKIILGNKGYGCTNYKSGCTFVIWKESFGKNLSIPMARSLIEKGATGKLKMVDDQGHGYEGRIVLKDKNTGKLEVTMV